MEGSSTESDLPAVYQAAALVSTARRKTWILRAELEALRERTAIVEAEVRIIGSEAITLPEDIGAWKDHGPRVEGLASRICQVYEQADALASLQKEK
jgi:hypothetical protein